MNKTLSAHRVYWAVDNGFFHRGQAATGRLTKRYSHAVMSTHPVHASC
ncbi:hypothetical protein [Actinomadura rudentiformis]|nr:hypothetical protein [Actinomadura rudentiformis]